MRGLKKNIKVIKICIFIFPLSCFLRSVPSEFQPAGRDGGSEAEHQQTEQRGAVHVAFKPQEFGVNLLLFLLKIKKELKGRCGQTMEK